VTFGKTAGGGGDGSFSSGLVNADTKYDQSGSRTTATPVPSAFHPMALGVSW
jgi:hypothetical protein